MATEWRPSDPVRYAPLFCWPARPASEILAWCVGFVWPWNLIWTLIAVASWTLFTPPIAAARELALAWVLPLLLRNLALMWLVYGGWHLALYTLKLNGLTNKYNPAPPATNDAKFTFGDQVAHEMLYSHLGWLVWTGYEVAFMHWWATDRIPWVADGWWAHGAYNTALLLAIPFWREFHFYVVHRALHWGPLYRAVHSLHHKSANPTPWSGLSMHPVELLGYFSVLLIHCVVPSHPLHVIFNAQHTALTPASGHSGYHPPVLGGVPMGSYFHYLHHRYLSVNFGEATLPLDWMFGTFRDGGAEGGDAAVAGGGAPGKGSARKAKRVD